MKKEDIPQKAVTVNDLIYNVLETLGRNNIVLSYRITVRKPHSTEKVWWSSEYTAKQLRELGLPSEPKEEG